MEIGVLIIVFGSIFGIFYLFFSTRNKERLALIEKGVDASIFMSAKSKGSSSLGKVFILNLSLLLIGIGLGVFLALILETYTGLDSDAIYPAMIFLMAGVGLFTGFNLTKKLDKE
ncbi:DUF6249 domain-containing protein [uncultured Polaribacter sp.]|uniref:DUF6249 domain-containing protein n=1 Tax=uncultured Polaribacter sp. TaxID=174711 RepID=UPI0026024974|nr:DUF6249 domain-containing protein [uncultured Polaribacter sp.]